jgi:FixJ family two-component response regulator
VSADAVVFVVDDDASVRRSLARLLRSAGFEVETFASAEDFLSAPHPECPSCLVLDLRMPGIGGLDLQHQLAEAGLAATVVFLTGHGTVPVSVQAMKAGAVDFIQKPFDGPDLLAAVGRAVDRHRQMGAARGEREQVQSRFEVLTPRERQVLALVVAGLPNKLVAGRLGITEKTVKVHRGRVMAKMNAASLADLVRMGEKVGVRGEAG